MTTPPGPDEPTPPPGYVPAPGGYGYVPEDYRWEAGQVPGHGTHSPTHSPTYGTSSGEPASRPVHPAGKPTLANWPHRAAAGLIDFFGPYLLALFLSVSHRWLATLLFGATLTWGFGNGYLQGQTGQSVGKQVIGLRTVREQDGQPIGGTAGLSRACLHLFDILPCGLGLLFPLWDAKRQTFADKITGTIVVRRR